MEAIMRNKVSNILWGIFIIAIGIGLAGNELFDWNFDVFFKGWWTLLIIIPCFISMIQTRFGVGSTIGFIIGVLLLVSCYVNLSFNIMRLIVPAILIYIGLRIMLKSLPKNTINNSMHTEGQNGQQGFYNSTGCRSEYCAVFSSNKIHADGQFTGTSLNAVFGSVVLDLRDAVITNDVQINATAVFGGIDIFIPGGIRVKINNIPIFGGVSNKAEECLDAGAPVIYLNSTCMFGGIDIK
jgi:predicted membrane protein